MDNADRYKDSTFSGSCVSLVIKSSYLTRALASFFSNTQCKKIVKLFSIMTY